MRAFRNLIIVSVLARCLTIDAFLDDDLPVTLVNNVTNAIQWPDALIADFNGDVSSLESSFSKFQQMDKKVEPPARKQVVQAVLGIFTTLNKLSVDVRKVHRQTWMKHPNVCTILNTSSACTVRVVFVAAARGLEWVNQWTSTVQGMRILRSEPDLVLLDTEPQIGSGLLAYSWIDFATNRFDWAHYIGKMDDDVFPHVSRLIDTLPVKVDFGKNFKPTKKFGTLLDDLHIVQDDCEAYIGTPWSCWGGDHCPPTSCGPPMDRDFMKYNSTDKKAECWSYMKGSLYFLSENLAQHLKKPRGFFDSNKYKPEDEILGQAVHTFARDSKKCVRTLSKEDVLHDRLYTRSHHEHEAPAAVSGAWDSFYGK